MVGRKRSMRKFTLQLYDNTILTVDQRFELEARLLDGLAKRIDGMLGFGRAPSSATNIRHDATSFHCYVGRLAADKMLIVMPHTTSVIDWSPSYRRGWCIVVTNKWREANGYAPLDGNDLPRPVETNGRVANSSLSTGTDDG